MHHYEADVCTSLCHSQGSSSAAIPMLDRYAGWLLLCQAHVHITRHMWHVLRLRITKEEACQLSCLFPGMFPLHFLWSLSVKATAGLQGGCACESWLSQTSHVLSDWILPNKVILDYLMSDQGLWHSKGCKLSQRRHSPYNVITINSQMNIRAIEL